jgi:hypothetical protein
MLIFLTLPGWPLLASLAAGGISNIIAPQEEFVRDLLGWRMVF